MQLKFGYPRRGLTGVFNTFRLGLGWADKLAPGLDVELVDARRGTLLKRATVVRCVTGKLNELAPVHARWAHNWREHPEDQRAELLIASMKKRYPPNRVRDDSPVTVVYLKEKSDDSEHGRCGSHG